ncbi:MAG: hypothetical protein MUC79_12285 [Thiobacillaceae bacterium]|jgi:hypothetical protein|nr:hypothetical protein [Thiobacillaceae bacterium]
MKRLHLILDNLPHPEWVGGAAVLRRHAPALAALLDRGRPEPAESGLSAALGRLFGLPAHLPLAPYTLAGEGITPGEATWMRADPVCLRLHQDRMMLVGTADLVLQPDEAQTLVADLNRHFSADGLTFLAPSAERWYLRVEAVPDLRTSPPDAVAGRPIDAHLPVGGDAWTWLARFTEVQMLLHDHPVNQDREVRGLPPVNSLWFWGAGRHAALPAPGFARLAAAHPTALALAEAAGLPHGQAGGLAELTTGDTLAILELPQKETADDMLEDLARLDRLWFRPALRRLRGGGLRQLGLETTGALALRRSLTPLEAWRFWRKSGLRGGRAAE